MLDLASTKGLLDWAQAGAFDFSRLCRQHWHGGAGGSSLNPFQASEKCFVLETHGCTSSVPTWHTSNCLWLLNLAWWGIKRNRSCFAGWRMATLSWRAICFEVLPAILKKRLGTPVAGFCGAATSLFVLDCLCFMEAIFGFNFWETASICHWGEAKNCFIFDINFWLRVWSPSLLFFAHVAGNSHLAWGRSGRLGAEWVVTALVRF